MDIWEPNKLLLFLAFFIPGFISIKVYQLLVASEAFDFSKSLAEAIGFSSLNYATFFWVIPFIHYHPLYHLEHPIIYYLGIFLIVFVMPILWPFIYQHASKHKLFNKFIISPYKTAWDYKFDKREPNWVIINLSNGEKIAGVYSTSSFASAYPRKEQIFLEAEWKVDKTGKFLNKIPSSKGVIINCDNIKSIQFF